MFERARLVPLLLGVLLLVFASCKRTDNSAETDRATSELAKARTKLDDTRHDLATTTEDIDRRKRALVAEQQALADQEKALAANRQALGSAQTTVVEARAAYGAAVTSRKAKLDAAIAELATRGDAAARDAVVGLRARRDVLATQLAAMPTVAAAAWSDFARDLDTTFDAIERDLQEAAH